ncbi:hypothetical protein P5673_005601 [Acropora cervicornis]|uniref:Uncharacterized protein n=1 Tax=Acropora cervicornis TaxID=6130 RepID=A0AAD9VD93_ACRCE|nr:hypothetical protein P5673_005601 [Acropora cervicornis]
MLHSKAKGRSNNLRTRPAILSSSHYIKFVRYDSSLVITYKGSSRGQLARHKALKMNWCPSCGLFTEKQFS